MFSTKENKSVDQFGYLNQYSCKVKMALIIESIFISKTVVSLHIKVHEVYVNPLKPRLTIKESDDENSDNEEQDLENIIMKNISGTEDLD